MKGPKYTIGKNENEIVLAEYCQACSGVGLVKEYNPGLGIHTDVYCYDCEALGFFITEDGAQILALVKDVLLKDAS